MCWYVLAVPPALQHPCCLEAPWQLGASQDKQAAVPVMRGAPRQHSHQPVLVQWFLQLQCLLLWLLLLPGWHRSQAQHQPGMQQRQQMVHWLPFLWCLKLLLQLLLLLLLLLSEWVQGVWPP